MSRRIPHRVTLRLAGAFLLALSSRFALAGEGERFIGPHNTIVRMLTERTLAAGLSTNDLVLKEARSADTSLNSVRQSDLNALRAKTIVLLSNHYVLPGGFDLTQQNPTNAFPNLLRYDGNGNLLSPSAMDGIGSNGRFTKVAAEFTAGGAVYANDFTDVPVLGIHLRELHRAVCAMTASRLADAWVIGVSKRQNSRKYLYKYASGGVVNTWEESCDYVQQLGDYTPSTYTFPIGLILGSLNVENPYGTGDGYYWTISYHQVAALYRLENLPALSGKRIRFYCYAQKLTASSTWVPSGAAVTQNAWSMWDEQSLGEATQADSGQLGAPGDLTPGPAPVQAGPNVYSGFRVTGHSAIVSWDGFETPPFSDPAQDDPELDGVLASPCECFSCIPSAEVGADASGAVKGRYDLGLSSAAGANELAVKATVQDFTVDGARSQMFNLDTRIVGHTENSGEGWEFVVVRRPSGAEVTFALAGPHAHRPAGLKNDYRLYKSAAEYELQFGGAENIVHRFGSLASGGALKRVGKSVNGEAVALDAVAAPDQWPGGLTVARDAGEIRSVTSPGTVATPVYSGGLIRGVHKETRDGGGQTLLGMTLSESVLGGETLLDMTISETTDGDETVIDYVRSSDPPARTQARTSPGGARSEIRRYSSSDTNAVASLHIRQSSHNPASGITLVTETTVVYPDTPSLAASNAVVTVLMNFPWGEEVVAVTNGVLGPELETTVYGYQTNSAANGYGLLAVEIRPDGSWTRYEYDSADRLSRTVTPFGSSDADAPPDQCRTTEYTYAGDPALSGLGFPAADVAEANDTRPRLVVEKALGIEVSRAYHAFLAEGSVDKRCQTRGAPYTAGDNLTAVTEYYRPPSAFAGRVARATHPDGTITTYAYDFLGRLTGTAVSNSTGLAFQTAYGFDDAGRLDSVSDGVRSAVYAYDHHGPGRCPGQENRCRREAGRVLLGHDGCGEQHGACGHKRGRVRDRHLGHEPSGADRISGCDRARVTRNVHP